jgi:transcriptional regulator with XRE-family HTH domain
LGLATKLRDKNYRKRFFLAEASAHIAKQLIELRKLRQLTQKDLAKLAGTGQPAISRAERADYHNWSFNTLRSLAEVMDARIRVLIEPAEKILSEYEPQQTHATIYAPETRDAKKLLAAMIQSEPKNIQMISSIVVDSTDSQPSAASAKAQKHAQPALRLIETIDSLGGGIARSFKKPIERNLRSAA